MIILEKFLFRENGMMKSSINIWENVITCLKKYDNPLSGYMISRQELLLCVYGYGKKKRWYTTVDIYRRYLSKAGYLKSLKPGVYQILKIPYGKSTIQIKEEAYPGYIARQKELREKYKKYLFRRRKIL